MPKTAGSIWIDGNTFHYVDSTGAEWYATGTAGSIVSGTPGSVWIDNTNVSIKYLDASSRIRTLPSAFIAARSGSVVGSIWISNTSGTSATTGSTQFRFIADNGGVKTEFEVHEDVAFADVAHADQAHTDSHTDDSYSDGGFCDTFSDSCHNVGYTDGHQDNYAPGFGYCYHEDNGYGDNNYYCEGFQDTFIDDCGYGNYGDYSDYCCLEPVNPDPSFSDSYSTGSCPHVDISHGDVPYADQPYLNDPHQDVAHADQPIYVGP